MIRAVLFFIICLGTGFALVLKKPVPEVSEGPVAEAPVEDSAITRAQIEFDALNTLSASLEAAAETIEAQPELQVSAMQPEPVPQQVVAFEALPQQSATVPAETSPVEQMIVAALTQDLPDTEISTRVETMSRSATDLPRHDRQKSVEKPNPTSKDHDPSVSTISAMSSYVVQPGDSLAAISFQFYGHTDGAAEIFTANRAVLHSPDHVEIGQQLVIPIH